MHVMVLTAVEIPHVNLIFRRKKGGLAEWVPYGADYAAGGKCLHTPRTLTPVHSHAHTHVCTRANLLSLLSLTLLLQITSPRCCTANTSVSETWQPGPAASRPWRTTSLCTTTTSSSPTTRVSGWTGTAQGEESSKWHSGRYVWSNYEQKEVDTPAMCPQSHTDIKRCRQPPSQSITAPTLDHCLLINNDTMVRLLSVCLIGFSVLS